MHLIEDGSVFDLFPNQSMPGQEKQDPAKSNPKK